MNSVTRLLVACARFESTHLNPEHRQVILNELQGIVATVFGVLATALAANPKWQDWRADDKNPGFLVHTMDDIEIRIPWNLLNDFPPADVLKEFVSLAKMIRSGEDTAICISGSAALRASIFPIGDIDFCEYVSAPPHGGEERSFARTIRRAVSLADDSLVCIGLKSLHPFEVRNRPWKVSPEQDKDFLSQAAKSTQGKCDFIGKTSSEGVLEITNLVLFLDAANSETGSGLLSFPPQEAPMTPEGGWVPRRLAQPLILGRYINWLRDQVARLLSEPKSNLGKAAKRALSLTRILFLDELGNRTVDLMQKQRLLPASAIQARIELLRKIEKLKEDPAVMKFEPDLSTTLRELVEILKDPALSFPSSGLDDDWCRQAESHLRSSVGTVAKMELSSMLNEITGHFGEG